MRQLYVARKKHGPERGNRIPNRAIIGRVLCHLSYLGMEHLVRIELTPQPYQSCAPPSTLEMQNLEPGAELEAASIGYKPITSPSTLTGQIWSTAGDLNSALRDTNPEHRRLCLQCKFWSGVRESNPVGWFGRPEPNQSANPAFVKYCDFKELWSGISESN